MSVDDTASRRRYRLILAAIVGAVVVLVMLISGITLAAMYNTQQNAKARAACIASGGTWIQANCVGIK